jgi:hypothetical protein
MLTTTIALLVAFSGSMQPGSSLPDPSQIHLVKDSAHTLFTPNAPDPGRAGQVYELPQGGLGVTTGGTSHYQTMITPGGSGIAVPNGNNTFDMMGSGGRAGVGLAE